MNKEILYKFFEGFSSLDEELAIKNWIKQSDHNRREFFSERKIYDASILLEEERKELRNTPSKSISLGAIVKELIKIAAIVAITLLGGHFYSQYTSSLDMQTISIPAGQRANILLPDGTSVWLNARTTMKYPVSFNGKNRHVQLDGEAYFNVAKNTKKPFVVQTKQYNIEVLGTEFNVEAYSDTDIFETALMSGGVKLSLIDNPAEILILSPNTKAFRQNGQLLTAAIDNLLDYSWIEGFISFRNESFATIMGEFEKSYGVQIRIENKNVNDYKYTGKFHQSDGVDYALRVLQKDMKFVFYKDAEENIFYIK